MKSQIYTVSLLYQGKEIVSDNKAPLKIVPKEPYKCSNCDKEITKEQIMKALHETSGLSSTQNKIIDQVLPYINKYRKNFGLDTCLRKAHFIAQICHESDRFKTLEEIEFWNYKNNSGLINNIPGTFSNNEVTFDNIIGESLLDHLKEIFVIKDKDDNPCTKTNVEIKTILLKNKIKICDKKLYANYTDGEKLLKVVYKEKDDILEEMIEWKIYLQNHTCFKIPLVSRMYAPYTGDTRGLGNGDELSRDGWKFKGRGLKQLTGRYIYTQFSNYRNKLIDTGTSFEDDDVKIDFTGENDTADLTEGNYLKLSDDSKFAVQSSLWFWNEGTPYNGKKAKAHADNDNSLGVSSCVNRNDYGSFPTREKYYLRARKSTSFDVINHFKEMSENGTASEKEQAKEYFEKWAKKDPESARMLNELLAVKPLKPLPASISFETIRTDDDKLTLKLM